MIKADASTPASLFGGIAFPDDAFCECFLPESKPRDHWRPIVEALGTTVSDVLKQRQERVRRMRHEDGATYNPFDDPTGKGVPWALDMIPLPLTENEWSELETGLIQRAVILEKILKDVYGPQKMLKEGLLPPELVFANPNFMHICHGIQPMGNRHLSYYAADIYRGADGDFRVLRDYGANPSGLGYALENRIVISRVFPELYHKTQVRRLATFFQAFHHSMIQRISLRQKEPSIVLLSPGPDSPIYFEHALLSRYMGYPLVEGQDLTVRNGRVFLKKLAGLEPVESIFRHVADGNSDPFALRRETAAGVAGLIQVFREQNIDIVNPIGSGFVETPVLPVFLPSLCRLLLGEDLLLENHPAWWCGNNEGQGHVTAKSEQLTIAPAMERSLTSNGSGGLMKSIASAPYAFMATDRIRPSAVPVWNQSGVQSSFTLMRLFACATEHGFTVMPGGLSIVAADLETLTSNCRERQQSKDIWVLSDRPVAPFSLMEGLQSVAEIKRVGDLPSRVADHLLWLGRYLERAEGMVRLLRSIFRRLSGEARPADVPELMFLLNLLRGKDIIPRSAEGDNGIPRYRELSAQLNDALYKQDRPESVVFVLTQVKEAARKVRDRLSLDSWRVINRLEYFGETRAGDLLEILDNTLFTLSAFSGLAMESMTRSLGWRFMDTGRRLERAMNLAGLIRDGLPRLCADSRSALEALLEVFDSIMTYRARYRSAFQLAPAMDLLLKDEGNPRSLAFQFNQLLEHVNHFPPEPEPRNPAAEEQMSREMVAAIRSLDLSGLHCRESDPENEDLKTFLESMELRLKDFAQQISAHYLSRVQSTPHFSMIGQGGRP